MAYIGREPTNTGEFLLLDNVSGSFNGSTTGFTLTVGTSKVTPAKENTIIALDGVLQTSGDAYTISGSTLNFTEAPAAGTTFYGILAGQSQYISNSSINNDHISGTANISGSKINTDFSAQSLQLTHVTASGNISASGNLYGTVATPAQTSITSVGTIGTGIWNSTFGATANTLVSGSLGTNATLIRSLTAVVISGSANAANISGSFTTTSSSLASKVTTLEGTGTAQGVGTTNSPTFADVTATGTVTAQEFHTEFISASVIYDSGSTRFGDTTDDTHAFTGSLTTSGSSLKIDSAGGYSGSVTSTGSFGSTHVMGNLNIGTVTASPSASVTLGTSTSALTISGSIFPEGDNNHDLGSLNYRWAGIYTTDLELSNKGVKGNDIDGTSGHWTIQEGKENLYLINNETNKKFKFKLEEIE